MKTASALVLFIFFLSPAFAATGNFEFTADTIEIRGRFPDSCAKPPYVFITKYDNISGELGRVVVNPNGEFVHHMAIAEPGEIVFRIGTDLFDFIATGKQTVYELEFSCADKKVTGINVINSLENVAYKAFYALRKKLKTDLEAFKDTGLDNPEVFTKFQQLMLEYQKQLSEVTEQHQGTFTAEHLCAADKLSEQALSSIAALRQQYLSRSAFSSPYLYNTFLGPRLFSNYFDFIRHKSDTSFTDFENLLKTVSVNTATAKKLQFMLYDAFARRHLEWLMKGYTQWANDNPGLMVQQVIKLRLQRIAKCLPGEQFIDVVLNDTAGNPRSLSKTVAASKLTLLVFYSPTCSHCKEELPRFIPLWQEYKNKGFSVFTVAGDDNQNEWNRFIAERTGTGWVNVKERDDHYYNSAYVVSTTPAFVLINTNGIILSRLATADEALASIPQLLAK